MDWTFGTEELASYSHLMREAEAAPVLLIHPDDAGKLGLSDGDRAALHLPKGSLAVTVKLAATLAPGVVVLPRHRQLDWRKLAEMPVYLSAQPHRPRWKDDPMSLWVAGIIFLIVKLLVVLVALLLFAAYLIYVERRLLGFLQLRLGPNRAGP